MFNTMAMPSLADIAAVSGNRNNNGGWGDGNGWWVLIILFAIFGGWGGNGYGNGNGRGNDCCCNGGNFGGWGAFDAAALQRGFDNSGVIQKLDGINSGICSLGYDQLNQMNGINTNIMQTGFGLQQAINQDVVAGMQNTTTITNLIQSCCCDLRSGLKDLQYTMATDTCALKNEIHGVGDMLNNTINWNSRNLSDTIRDGFAEMQRQNDQRYIAELERKLNNCDRDSALQGTASYIINAVNPRSQPAYLTCNPNTGNVWPMTTNAIPVQYVNQGCGCNQNSCGCGCGCN